MERELFASYYTGSGMPGREEYRLFVERADADVEYLAPAPLDRRTSFSGSGLPYPSARHAFSNSPNQGRARTGRDGELVLRLTRPCGFYECCGTSYTAPFVLVRYVADGVCERHALPGGDGANRWLRDITWPDERTSPMFYMRDPVVEDQWVRLLRTRVQHA